MRSRCVTLNEHPTSLVKGAPKKHKWKEHNSEGIERVFDRIKPLMLELGYDTND